MTTERFSPCAILPCLLLTVATVLLGSGTSFARDLTFEERVAAQEAIERVYYSHQMGATLPFEEAVSPAVLEGKVRAYLKQSVALEQYWHTPITAEMLKAETERMTRTSRMPERLREIRTALKDDYILFQECYARPVLADRLIHGFFDYDRRMHGDAFRRAQELHDSLKSGRLSVWRDDPRRTVVDSAILRRNPLPGPSEPVQVPGSGGSSARIGPEAGAEESEWLRAGVPAAEGQVGPVIEERSRFVIKAILGLNAGHARVAEYSVPKVPWADWWKENEGNFTPESVEAVARTIAISPEPGAATAPGSPCLPGNAWDNGSLDDVPEPTNGQTAVWTGTEMIVWGGPSQSGSRYDPLTDSWMSMTTKGAPQARTRHSAVWAGNEMIVWGGLVLNGFGSTVPTSTGGRYNPATDTWTSVSTVEAPSNRSDHTAIWTGSKMIVWGGGGVSTGGVYDPSQDTWTSTSLVNAPSPRYYHTAVWTGRAMVVWGGRSDTMTFSSGGRYDPDSDTWTPTSTLNAPASRYWHSSVWTGSEMIIWGGGWDDPKWGLQETNTGGRYNPESDTWAATSTLGAPLGRLLHSAVWTGSLMIIWGGEVVTSVGGRYDPVQDAWMPTSALNAPGVRYGGGAVWTGNLMLVWVGMNSPEGGGRYDPSADIWTPISEGNAPEARNTSTGVWTGNVMVVWGGTYRGNVLDSGGRYDPAADSWAPITKVGAPAGRGFHTAIWTGSQMIVWGGSYWGATRTDLNTGGRYDPIADVWQPTTLVNAPDPRSDHTAIWTGNLMVIWGGDRGYPSTALDTGGRYDPLTDRWLPTTTVGAPSARYFGVYRTENTSAWTGSFMVIWGGFGPDNPARYAGDGARYDPVNDRWLSISSLNAPSRRGGHSVIWDGREVIVWGGEGDSSSGMNTGGRYDPSSDVWTTTATASAPGGRWSHSAVWTGQEMLVWGGIYGRGLNSGGRYDPVSDAWTATSLENAPSGRIGHVSIWTGLMMIVWGDVRTGGRYAPAPLGDLSVSTDLNRNVECSGVPGTRVQLSATAQSCNPAGELTYLWSGPFPEGDGAVDSAEPVVTLPLGASALTLTVEDSDGRRATQDVRVEVADTTPPTVLCPPAVTAECSSASGADVVVPSIQVTDACDAHPLVVNSHTSGGPDASGAYALGRTDVTATAVDASGNSAGCLFPVSVQDTTPPRVSSAVTPSILWPPNHRMVDVAAAVAATDACSTPAVLLTSVTSSEPDDAPGNGDGNTVGDIQGAQVGTPSFDFQLRAERDGAGQGRAYRITYTAVDGSGNQASASSIVFVPHDQGGGAEPVLISADRDAVGTVLTWSPVPGASTYQAIRGSVGSLSDAGAFIDLGTVACIQPASGTTSTQSEEDAEDPPLGEAFFYLVAYNDGQDSGYGSDTATKPRVRTGGGCE